MPNKIPRRKFSFAERLTAVFLSATLVLSNTAGYAGTNPSSSLRGSVPNKAEARLPGGQAISIPTELGSVEESFSGTSGKTIIYIQDAHDSLEAQENSAKIIGHLVKTYGVKTVFEEGYEGPVPTDDYFSAIKDPKIKEKVSHFLMDKLRIGGAEYAHINRPHPDPFLRGEGKVRGDFKLIGADNIKLHLENIEWYRKNAQHQEDTEKDLAVLAKEIEKLANKNFPKELKEWMKLKERFDGQKLPLLDYLKRVLAAAAQKPTSRHCEGTKCPKQSLSLEIASASSGIPPRNDDERDTNIHLLLAAEKSSASADKGTGNIPLLARHLFGGPAPLLSEIDTETLFEEIDRLENQFSKEFLKSETNQKIFQYYKGINLLRRLNKIEITPAEYEAVKGGLQNLNTQGLAEFIARNTQRSMILSKRWEANIQNAVKFYELARQRDQAIEKALLSSPNAFNGDLHSASRFRGNDVENADILVFGGFHKEQIRQLLKKNGMACLIVTPKISSEDSIHKAYYRDLMTRDYAHLEIPPLVAHASVNPHGFELAELGGPRVRSELRSQIQDITKAFEQISEQLAASAGRSEMRTETELSREGQSLGIFPWDQIEGKLRQWFAEAPGGSGKIETLSVETRKRFIGSTRVTDFSKAYDHLRSTKENLEKSEGFRIREVAIVPQNIQVPETGKSYSGLRVVLIQNRRFSWQWAGEWFLRFLYLFGTGLGQISVRLLRRDMSDILFRQWLAGKDGGPHPQIKIALKLNTLLMNITMIHLSLMSGWSNPVAPLTETSLAPEVFRGDFLSLMAQAHNKMGMIKPVKEALLIGPGLNSNQIQGALEAFPELETLHVLAPTTAKSGNFGEGAAVEDLAKFLEAHPEIKTRVKFYQGTVLLLPQEFKDKMDLVIMLNVLARYHFEKGDVHRAYREISAALKASGFLIAGYTSTDHVRPDSPELEWQENPFEPLAVAGVLNDEVLYRLIERRPEKGKEPVRSEVRSSLKKILLGGAAQALDLNDKLKERLIDFYRLVLRRFVHIEELNENLRELSKAGPLIIVADHISWLDPLIAAEFFIHTRRWPLFVADRNPLGSNLLSGLVQQLERQGAVITVSPEGGTRKKMVAHLQNNGVLGIFPGGHIAATTGEIFKSWKSSAARISIETNAPIVPLVFWGDVPSRLGRQEWKSFLLVFSVQGLFAPPFQLNGVFGKPIYPQGKSADQIMEELIQQISGILHGKQIRGEIFRSEMRSQGAEKEPVPFPAEAVREGKDLLSRFLPAADAYFSNQEKFIKNTPQPALQFLYDENVRGIARELVKTSHEILAWRSKYLPKEAKVILRVESKSESQDFPVFALDFSDWGLEFPFTYKGPAQEASLDHLKGAIDGLKKHILTTMTSQNPTEQKHSIAPHFQETIKEMRQQAFKMFGVEDPEIVRRLKLIQEIVWEGGYDLSPLTFEADLEQVSFAFTSLKGQALFLGRNKPDSLTLWIDGHKALEVYTRSGKMPDTLDTLLGHAGLRSEMRAQRPLYKTKDEFIEKLNRVLQELGTGSSLKNAASKMGYARTESFLSGAARWGITREDLETLGIQFPLKTARWMSPDVRKKDFEKRLAKAVETARESPGMSNLRAFLRAIAKQMGYADTRNFLVKARRYKIDFKAYGIPLSEATSSRTTPARQWLMKQAPRLLENPEEREQWVATVLFLADFGLMAVTPAYALVTAARTGKGSYRELDEKIASDLGINPKGVTEYLTGKEVTDSARRTRNMMDFLAEAANIKWQLEESSPRQPRSHDDIPDPMMRLKQKFWFGFQAEYLLTHSQYAGNAGVFFEKILSRDGQNKIFSRTDRAVLSKIIRHKSTNYSRLGRSFRKRKPASEIKRILFGRRQEKDFLGLYHKIHAKIEEEEDLKKEFEAMISEAGIQRPFNAKFFWWLRSRKYLSRRASRWIGKLVIYHGDHVLPLRFEKPASLDVIRRIIEAYFRGERIRDLSQEPARFLQSPEFENSKIPLNILKNWLRGRRAAGRYSAIERFREALEKDRPVESLMESSSSYHALARSLLLPEMATREEGSPILTASMPDWKVHEMISKYAGRRTLAVLFLRMGQQWGGGVDARVTQGFTIAMQNIFGKENPLLESAEVLSPLAAILTKAIEEKDTFLAEKFFKTFLEAAYTLRYRFEKQRAGLLLARIIQSVQKITLKKFVAIDLTNTSGAEDETEGWLLARLISVLKTRPQNVYWQETYPVLAEMMFKPVRIISDEAALDYEEGRRRKPSGLRYLRWAERYDLKKLREFQNDHEKRLLQQSRIVVEFLGTPAQGGYGPSLQFYILRRYPSMIKTPSQPNGISLPDLINESKQALLKTAYRYTPQEILTWPLEKIEDASSRGAFLSKLDSWSGRLSEEIRSLEPQIEEKKETEQKEEGVILRKRRDRVLEEKKLVDLTLQRHRAYEAAGWETAVQELKKKILEARKAIERKVILKLFHFSVRNQILNLYDKHSRALKRAPPGEVSLEAGAGTDSGGLGETLEDPEVIPVHEQISDEFFSQSEILKQVIHDLPDPRKRVILQIRHGLDPAYEGVPVSNPDLAEILAFRGLGGRDTSIISNERVAQLAREAQSELTKNYLQAVQENLHNRWNHFISGLGLGNEGNAPEPLAIYIEKGMNRIPVGSYIFLPGLEAHSGKTLTVELSNYEEIAEPGGGIFYQAPGSLIGRRLYPQSLLLTVHDGLRQIAIYAVRIQPYGTSARQLGVEKISGDSARSEIRQGSRLLAVQKPSWVSARSEMRSIATLEKDSIAVNWNHSASAEGSYPQESFLNDKAQIKNRIFDWLQKRKAQEVYDLINGHSNPFADPFDAILSNALRAVEESENHSGLIRVKLRIFPDHALLEILDQGSGIREEAWKTLGLDQGTYRSLEPASSGVGLVNSFRQFLAGEERAAIEVWSQRDNVLSARSFFWDPQSRLIQTHPLTPQAKKELGEGFKTSFSLRIPLSGQSKVNALRSEVRQPTAFLWFLERDEYARSEMRTTKESLSEALNRDVKEKAEKFSGRKSVLLPSTVMPSGLGNVTTLRLPLWSARSEMRANVWLAIVKQHMASDSENKIIDKKPAGYQRVVYSETIESALRLVPPFLLKFFGFNYVRTIALIKNAVSPAGVRMKITSLQKADGSERFLSIMTVNDVPAELKNLYLRLTVGDPNQLMKGKVPPMPLTLASAQEFSKMRVIHEVGEVLWETLPPELHEEWERIHERREGWFYKRNTERKDPKAEIFADTFSLYIDPHNVAEKMGEKPLSVGERGFFEKFLKQVEEKARGLEYIPGTFVAQRSEVRKNVYFRIVRKLLQQARKRYQSLLRRSPGSEQNRKRKEISQLLNLLEEGIRKMGNKKFTDGELKNLANTASQAASMFPLMVGNVNEVIEGWILHQKLGRIGNAAMASLYPRFSGFSPLYNDELRQISGKLQGFILSLKDEDRKSFDRDRRMLAFLMNSFPLWVNLSRDRSRRILEMEFHKEILGLYRSVRSSLIDLAILRKDSKILPFLKDIDGELENFENEIPARFDLQRFFHDGIALERLVRGFDLLAEELPQDHELLKKLGPLIVKIITFDHKALAGGETPYSLKENEREWLEAAEALMKEIRVSTNSPKRNELLRLSQEAVASLKKITSRSEVRQEKREGITSNASLAGVFGSGLRGTKDSPTPLLPFQTQSTDLDSFLSPAIDLQNKPDKYNINAITHEERRQPEALVRKEASDNGGSEVRKQEKVLAMSSSNKSQNINLPSQSRQTAVGKTIVFVDGVMNYKDVKGRVTELAVLAASDPKRLIIVYNEMASSGLGELLKSFGLSNIKFVPGTLSDVLKPYQFRDNINLVHYSGSEEEPVFTQTGLPKWMSEKLTCFVGEPGALEHGLKYLEAVKLKETEAAQLNQALSGLVAPEIEYRQGHYAVSQSAAASMRLLQETQFVTAFAQAA